MRKCKYCGNEVKWNYAENGGWHAAELDGSWHSCNGNRQLDPNLVQAICDSVTVSDRWIADKFIKRLSLYRYLYPRAVISGSVFIEGTLSDRQYLIRCSDKAFQQIMRTGKTGILQKREHAQV